MARIKIEDLPVLQELSEKQAKGIFGGYSLSTKYDLTGATTDLSRVRLGRRLDSGRRLKEGRLDGYEGWPCKW